MSSWASAVEPLSLTSETERVQSTEASYRRLFTAMSAAGDGADTVMPLDNWAIGAEIATAAAPEASNHFLHPRARLKTMLWRRLSP